MTSNTHPTSLKKHLIITMSKFKGYVLQRGTSPFNGDPFVVIMTMESSNSKTGNMCQVWILHEGLNPVDAINHGVDDTICGDCPHRKQADGSRSCYVNVGQAPAAVWKSYKRGIYGKLSDLDLRVITNRKVRWGSYGDPALIDPTLVRTINKHAAGHTGYTHQWRQPWAQWCKNVFQASCDSFADYLDASAHGWKTFAVVAKGGQPFSGKLCPATADNSEAKCITCSLCDGAKTDIFVEAHGSGASYVTN